jgi:hypothetical protein
MRFEFFQGGNGMRVSVLFLGDTILTNASDGIPDAQTIIGSGTP